MKSQLNLLVKILLPLLIILGVAFFVIKYISGTEYGIDKIIDINRKLEKEKEVIKDPKGWCIKICQYYWRNQECYNNENSCLEINGCKILKEKYEDVEKGTYWYMLKEIVCGSIKCSNYIDLSSCT